MPDIIYNFTDCTEATISTPTTNLEFLSDINNTNTSGKDYTNIECYRLTYSLNCCEDNVLDLPVPYDINFNIINCQSVTVLGTPAVIYTFEITGINGNFINNIQYELVGNPLTNLVFTVVNNVARVDILSPVNITVPEYDMKITTNKGFEYDINFNITQIITQICVSSTYSYTILNRVYPDLPNNVVIDLNNELDLLELYQTNPLLSGVYNIQIDEITSNSMNASIFNYYFIDCGEIKCKVVNELAICTETNVFNFYDALNYSNECQDSLLYSDICDIY